MGNMNTDNTGKGGDANTKRLRATLRNPSDCSVLTHSLNRCISDFANAQSKFLATLGTLDMPKPLDAISAGNISIINGRNIKCQTNMELTWTI